MLSDVCLSVAYIGPKSRTERPRKTKIGTQIAHVTHMWLGQHFQGQKVKGQGHYATLLTAALTRQASAAVSVGTYWAWEPTATLRCAGTVGSAARGSSAPTDWEERAGPPEAYCGGRPPVYSLLEVYISMCNTKKRQFIAQKRINASVHMHTVTVRSLLDYSYVNLKPRL